MFQQELGGLLSQETWCSRPADHTGPEDMWVLPPGDPATINMPAAPGPQALCPPGSCQAGTRSHYVTEETGVHKKVQATFPKRHSRRVADPQAGSLRVPKPRGNSRKDPSPRRGWGARRPQPGFHPARTSAVAALPLGIGKSLRKARPCPPAPTHYGGRLSAQMRRQERGREDVDRTCGLDVDTLTWTRSVGHGQLLLPRAGAASAPRANPRGRLRSPS